VERGRGSGVQPEGSESKLTSVAQKRRRRKCSGDADDGDVDGAANGSRDLKTSCSKIRLRCEGGDRRQGEERERERGRGGGREGGRERERERERVPIPEMGARLLIGRVGRKSPRDWLLLPR